MVDHGFAPSAAALASSLGFQVAEIVDGLEALAADHGVVLHPKSSRIWVIHPFSLAPTPFWVRSGGKSWWGGCAWCSLGIAGLMPGDTTITTTLGAQGRQVDVHIRDGRVIEDHLQVHFPVPMREAWDNVVYTCSTMLLFESVSQIDAWCRQHDIAKGDVQPIQNAWDFARVWYGEHLSPEWRKWTVSEAREIFARFGLGGEIWQLPASEDRF